MDVEKIFAETVDQISFSITDPEGNEFTPKLGLEETIFSNYKLIFIDDDIIDNDCFYKGMPVGITNHRNIYLLGSRVRVTDDGCGYICPGVSEPGDGNIVEVRRDSTDHWFGVQMDNGEFGYMKNSRIRVLEGPKTIASLRYAS